MSNETRIPQPEDQDRNVYNNYKRLLKNLGQLSNEQLAELNFQVYHEARMRTGEE